MFRLHRHRSNSFGERFEFRFSNLQAFQVPKGWDKLVVSLVSVETGKAIAKSSKAPVYGGTCQWADSFTESILVSQDGASKELEECLYKIVVSMGSSRSGILGEAFLNLSDHVHSTDSGLLQMPLEKCNYGTILQIKVQSVARIKSSILNRDNKGWKDTTFLREDPTTNSDNVDVKSDGSDNVFNRSGRSSSNNHMESRNKERSFSASGSHHSSDSVESLGRTNFSPQNSLNGGMYNAIGRQDSSGPHHNANYAAGHGDDISKSNHSSFNSRASGSSFKANQLQEVTTQTSLHGIAPVLLRSSDEDLLEVAEETIDDLRDQVKMWERHANQVNLELETLKKECSEKTKCQANLGMELSAAYAERDSFKQELEQLKLSVKESKTREAASGSAKIEKIAHVQKELEDEVKFLKESNASLNMQLKKTQESNLELVSILQELEDTVEKQNAELVKCTEHARNDELEDGSRSRALLDKETEWVHKLSMQEEEIKKLEEQLYDLLHTQRTDNTVSTGDHPDLIKEIESLRAKVQELERDCAELTEENLELIFKMKDSSSANKEGNGSASSTSNRFLDRKSCDSPDFDVSLLKLQINQLEQELKEKDELNENLTEPLTIQIHMLEEKCASLENERQHLKDQASELAVELQNYQMEIEEKEQELTVLCQKQEKFLNDDSGSHEKEESWSADMPKILSELNKQLYLALCHVKNLQYDGDSATETECLSDIDCVVPSVCQKEQVDNIIRSFVELNDILKTKSAESRIMNQDSQGQGSTEAEKWLKDNILYEQEFQTKDGKVKPTDIIVNLELLGNKSKIEELKIACSSKDEEIDLLRHSSSKLEDLISDVQKEKAQLEEKLQTALTESSLTSKCLEDVQHDLMVLTSSMDSYVSANKMLEKKSNELESSKHELELHISELEEENVQLSERISGLQAQLRYMTNEKESKSLELEDSILHIMELKDQISKQQIQMDAQKVELKQKLQETQKQLSESQEETELIKRSHSKLEGTVERLIGECNSIQKLTANFGKQKLELHDWSARLEAALGESLQKNFDFCNKVELLEDKLSSLQKDVISKEKSLAIRLESIFQENKEQEEKISHAYMILSQEVKKMVEVEKVEAGDCLTAHNKQVVAFNTECEVPKLHSDTAEIESSLQEARTKLKLNETEIYNLKQESDKKIQGLVDLLNASKQSEEILMGDIARMQRLIESLQSSEERFKRMANDLELKLKASDYEKQQISSLKLQLQKITNFEEEIMALKTSLNDAKFEKRKLEELFKSVSEECEELKTEKVSFMEKFSSMELALHDGEDDRCSRIALEEKLLRIECDLKAREALYAQKAEVKDELNQMKRSNSEYQRKIQSLEEEKDELMRRTQVLEKDLMHRKEQNEFVEDSNKPDNKPDVHMGKPEGIDELDLLSKIRSLETELTEALETNNMYKMQLQSFVSQKENGQAESDATTADHTDKISSLEAELRDVKERYMNLSLQFAELSAQREDLILKLKSTSKEKRWFS